MKPILTIGLLIFRCVSCARADEIVVPAAQATQAGNNSDISGFRAAGTVDEAYGTKNFSTSGVITELAFRMDEGTGGSFEVVIPRAIVRMSTFGGTYSSFLANGGYDSNKGADDTIVFDGPLHWSSTDLPSSAPNPFDFRIPLTVPFAYDPSKGPLLMRFQTSGTYVGNVIAADSEGHGDASIGWFGDKSLGNLVTQFDVTSIPEPQFGWLFALGTFALISARRKHHEHG